MADYCISICDMPLLDISKIVLQSGNNRVVADFQHPRILNQVAFTASLDFHFRDKGRWYTQLRVYDGPGVLVNQAVKARIKEQLTNIFVPYFNSVLRGIKLW